MHVLITGAAGMIGRKLAERIAETGTLGGRPVDRMPRPAPEPPGLERVEQRRHYPRARAAEGMSECDSAAAHIHLFVRDAELLHPCERNAGKGLVAFE